MKSTGYCTANEDGVFELTYTLEDSLFSKLFKFKMKFRFTCDSLNKGNFKQGLYSYDNLVWLDESGNVVTKGSQLKKINHILTESIIVEKYLDNIYGWEI
jgi:hypothetical protein